MKKITVAFTLIALLIAALVVTTYNTLSPHETLVAGAKVVVANADIGVYSDSRYTKPVSSINWGDLKQGETKNFVVYIKNIGTSKVTLSLTTSGWSSLAASQSITVSWNQQKTALTSKQNVQATIKLAVSQSINGNIDTFGFNIVITGTS